MVKKVDDHGFLENRIERLYFRNRFYSVNHVPMGSYLVLRFQNDKGITIKSKHREEEDSFVEFKHTEIKYQEGIRYKLFHFYIDEEYF